MSSFLNFFKKATKNFNKNVIKISILSKKLNSKKLAFGYSTINKVNVDTKKLSASSQSENEDVSDDNQFYEEYFATLQKVQNDSMKNNDEWIFDYNRNFKTLMEECYSGVRYLNSNFIPSELNNIILEFIENILSTNDISKNEKKIIEIYNKKMSLKQSEKVLNILIVLYEFLDRGMRGFLTGDISLGLVKDLEKILERKVKLLVEVENSLIAANIKPSDFYETYFKIDFNFFKNNSSKQLVLNLNNALENEGQYKKRLLYYVNLKHIQLCSNFNKDFNQDSLDEKKSLVQQIFNDMYNEILDECIVNKLKTPVNGIKNPMNESQKNLFRRQIFIEEKSFDNAHEDFTKIFSSLQNIDKAHDLFFNKKLLLNWHENLVFSIAESQKGVISKQEFLKQNKEFLSYFISLKAEEISMICLLYLIKIIINNLVVKKDDSDKVFLKAIQNKSKDVDIENDEFELNIPLVNFSEDLGTLFFQELRNTKVSNSFDSNKAKLFYKHINLNMVHFEVDKKDKIKIGMFLTQILLRNLSFIKEQENEGQEHSIIKIIQKQIDKFKKQNFVNIDKEFMIKYFNDMQKTFSQTIQIKRSLPMIYAPMPWKSSQIGSYYLRQTSFSKIFGENIEARLSYDNTNMISVMRTLDYLSNVGWRINEKVLDLVEYCWADGGGVASIPCRFNSKVIGKDDLKGVAFKEKLALLRESQENRENHSLRCDFLIKLQIARDFSKISEFYFPHNIDYRGRTYPISPHLNHIGNDFCRGLLEYSEAKELGKNGLRWLKIHLANVIGKDKLTLDQREKYIDSIINDVHKCAKDPYNNTFWQDTDNPWQTISTMFEVSAAINSGRPETYKTKMHCHVDGSCNGLQHYSALSRDYSGAYEVNLINRDKPGDVYSKVLDIVLDKIKNEQNPSDIKYAKLLQDTACVNRKVVKQTVMTSVYGVTLIGARDQIKKQLAEKKLFDVNTLFYVSMYLAKKTIESIGDLFREANQIKSWLTKCALVISHSGNTVKWLTPMGLPCVQPYRRITKTELVRTYSQGVMIMSDFDSQPVNKRKQGTAFPPNFIHSLDSTHMMMSCNRAIDKGLIFSSVHDSYWTHPSDIDTLNKILREEFVNLYTQPLLENLLRGFNEMYPELKFPEIPSRGTLDLRNVLNSTYFFS